MSGGSRADRELADSVRATLDTSGVLGELQAALRANVFKALEEQGGIADTKATAAIRRNPGADLALELVRDLLQELGLDYTLSVLGPEAGLADKPRSRSALASEAGVSGGASGGPVLLQLLHGGGGGGGGGAAHAAGRGGASSSSSSSPSPSARGGSGSGSGSGGGSSASSTSKTKAASPNKQPQTSKLSDNSRDSLSKRSSTSPLSKTEPPKKNSLSSLSNLGDLPGLSLSSTGGSAKSDDLSRRRRDIDSRISRLAEESDSDDDLEEDISSEGDLYSDDFSDNFSDDDF
jgi:FOP N terminal dimerisation domain